MNINLTNFTLIIVIAINLLLGYMHYNKSEFDSARMSIINAEIDSLEQCIYDKQTLIDSINYKSERLSDSIISVNKNIQSYKLQLDQIKNKYANIKPTNNATAHDVSRFFADRYNK